MRLANHPVQHDFGHSVRSHGERTALHTGDAGDWSSERSELGTGRFEEQGQHSLEEQKGSIGVDFDVRLEDVEGDGGNRGIVRGDAGVGNDGVDGGDALVLEFFDGLLRAFDITAVVGDDDELVVFAGREGLEWLRGAGGACYGNDGVVWTSQVRLDHCLSETWRMVS